MAIADPPLKTAGPGDRIDLGLAALMSILAFLLGWVEMFDTDVWWHVRAGEWILSHRSVPRLDPFSFASADRAWIDLHWGFQVMLALAHRVGGVPGLLLLASAACAAAFLVALAARGPGWPFWVGAWCWVPGLFLMSTRFDPRPESFSLLFTAVLLALLLRTERRPRLAWALPVVMAFWVNTHALFALGLVVIGGYVLGDLVATRCWRLIPAALLAGLACLANPYGLRGLLFPLDLFPKIADPASPYKAYVAEFMSLKARIEREGIAQVAGRLYILTHFFLLLVIPLSFLLPAVWRRWRAGAGKKRASVGPWAVTTAGAVGLMLFDAIALPGARMSSGMIVLGRFVPVALVLSGLYAAVWLGRTVRGAGILAAVGTIALAAWADWLRGYLFGRVNGLIDWSAPGSPILLALAAVGLVGPALALLIGAGAYPFRLFLSLVFGYLGLTADRNSNLFGLVAGTVLAWNFGEWAGCLTAGVEPARWRVAVRRTARAGLAALLVGWIGLVVTDRFFPLTGYRLHFGLRERPLTYAHDAARFAGEPGLPDRALVFDIGQAGVYVYHNSPRRKVFMDARLEVPSRATFDIYRRLEVALNRGDPRALGVVRRLGDPLVLLDHESNPGAEATFFTDPEWRCLYFDPMASVFVTRAGEGLESAYPTVDFASRHCARPRPIDPDLAYAEARALVTLSTTLRRSGATTTRSIRLGSALLALDRAFQVLTARPASAAAWTVIGHAVLNLNPAVSGKPPSPADPWDPANGLGWVQSTYCYRRSLKLSPGNRAALLSLRDSLASRRMTDATAGEASDLALPWPEAERQAALALHQGDPASARRMWERAVDPPSPGLRLARVGDTWLAALDLDRAADTYRNALNVEPRLGSAHYGLALTRLLQGRAPELLDACRAGLALPLTDPEREGLRVFEAFVGNGQARAAESSND